MVIMVKFGKTQHIVIIVHLVFKLLDHEKKCCNIELTVNKLFTTKLKQVLNRLAELEIKVKCHEEKDVEKDQQIENLKTQVENQRKQIENLNKQFEKQTKQTKENNNKIENQNKELEKVGRNNVKESIEVQNITTKIEELQQAIKMNSMIIPNISDDINIYPSSSAFQWKFNVSEVRSLGKSLTSAPFYNNMNPICLQLAVKFQGNNFIIGLVRYRGKYDDATNEITTTQDFSITIHAFGKNGKQKKLILPDFNFTIPHSEMFGKGKGALINNGEIPSLTIDGYANIHCFFNNTI